MESTADVTLTPWSEGDFGLLVRANAPEMTDHLGGPEGEEQLADRHRRYLTLDGRGQMFRITQDGAPAGTIGYWEREWRGATVWETGWGVLPEFQGRGIAVAAARLVVERARAEGRHPAVHAFPSVDHPASNAICRKAGFELLGEVDFEYPKGSWLKSNDWRIEL
ncbi:GNAT family N-acetyltransferase [Streptomyces sp. T-3]|nr:GNAT family N-acetyltransferase [Streptomyces sp. T-3]